MRSLRAAWAILPFFIASTVTGSVPSARTFDVFDRTTHIVSENFYDRTFRGLPWKQMVMQARDKISVESTDEELQRVINDLLEPLHASHTEFLSNADQEYWALNSVFSGEIDGHPIQQIGAWFDYIGGKWYVRSVFENSPAAEAGLLAGDEVIAVNGLALSPVRSFQHRNDKAVVTIRRNPQGQIHDYSVPIVKQSFQRVMLVGTRMSYRLIRYNEKTYGYFHLWAGTHDEFRLALADAVKKASSETDALILDLRDGFGGANPEYLDPLFDHDSDGNVIHQIYSKPMVALINDGVRSGKEWVAHILKQTHRATIVGKKTKGYFLAGRLFSILDGVFDLFLAVAPGPSGIDLEGNGVIPDYVVDAQLPYSSGVDLQLDRAIVVLDSLSFY